MNTTLRVTPEMGRRRMLAAVLTLSFGLVFGFSLAGGQTSRGAARDRAVPGGRPLEAIFDPREDLLAPGERTQDIGKAEQAMGFALATKPGAEPSEVWVSETGEAGVRYGSSLVLLYTKIEGKGDPAAVYAEQAADWKMGYATELSGHPAWVIPDHPGNPAPGVACIQLALDGVEIKLFGKMPIEDLVDEATALAEAS